jgi:hypothetical protein
MSHAQKCLCLSETGYRTVIMKGNETCLCWLGTLRGWGLTCAPPCPNVWVPWKPPTCAARCGEPKHAAHIVAIFWACLFIYAVIMIMKMFATKAAQKPTKMWGSESRYSGASQALRCFGCRSPGSIPAVMRAVPNVKIEWLF